MRWVYSAGTEKPKLISVTDQMKPSPSFFSFLGFGGNTPRRAPSPSPLLGLTEADYLEVEQSNVMLTIFTAEVDVNLPPEISEGLRKSMKKEPPLTLEYDMIYVSYLPQYRSQLISFPDRKG